MKSAVTIALVPEIKKGPWVFWNNLETGMQKAAALGFDAVELFTAAGKALDATYVKHLAAQHHIQIAAAGTGAGKVVQGLTLIDEDASVRARAIEFISEMIEFGAQLQAPAIIGSMQGNIPLNKEKEVSLQWLREGLGILGKKAENLGVPLIYEPLNRYETNLFNQLGDAVAFLQTFESANVKLLADLFHMNIEESSIPETILQYGQYIGHVHLADSNRQAMGFGHTDAIAIAQALKDVRYEGYLSAEVFPLPDSDAAAAQTIQAFRTWFS
ncbi:MAG: sugar phosphate isomerase/epimerase family protein [Agriterribacter sp.]